ncbi:hypothetical protein [Algoriphagus aquimarinus]|uniref:hypothetical protein n=1 Tax=Algoriphagus aquimarinus TaxID=237018 RepID=UPI0030DD0E66
MESLDPTVLDLRSVFFWVSTECIQPDQTYSFEWKASDVKDKHVVWADFLRKDGTSIHCSQPLPGQSAQ